MRHFFGKFGLVVDAVRRPEKKGFGPDHALDQALGEIESVVGAKPRSEEHTSELQSRLHLVCRLLLEKKKYHNYVHWLAFYHLQFNERFSPAVVDAARTLLAHHRRRLDNMIRPSSTAVSA